MNRTSYIVLSKYSTETSNVCTEPRSNPKSELIYILLYIVVYNIMWQCQISIRSIYKFKLEWSLRKK